MKNSPSAESRFTCRVVRGCLSIFGDTSGPEPRGLGASHVAACEDCQQFFGACDELTVALKRDAAREWREPPANLEQNIMRAVKLSTGESVSSARTSRAAWMSFGAVAACAVAVALVFQYRTPTGVTLPVTNGNVAVQPVDPAMVNAANELIAAVPSDLLAQMQPKAQELLEKNPLQTEVDAITSDARIAVRFLARNFLPTASTPAGSGE
jgi:hypothetical protein